MGKESRKSVGKESRKFDAPTFASDLKAARDASKPSKSEDSQHLSRIEIWTAALGLLGVIAGARGVISPLSMIALGYFRYAKFAILAHHSLHGGWGRERRGWFALTPVRRVLDWLDWIYPQAWIAEHNKIHHYALNEDADPDFVERNTQVQHEWNLPVAVKYVIVFAQAAIWKWFYYASNTLKLLHADAPNAPPKAEFQTAITMSGLFAEALKGHPWYRALAFDFVFRVTLLPFALYFLALPILAGVFWHGSCFSWTTFLNMLGGELVTNLHAYCTIVTNHAGSDLWWFDGGCKADTPEFYIRAVLGSTAYQAGNDFIDYFHGYLNYQGEHHAFPELSPLHYQRLHPLFKRVCARHGVPYVQEPVWLRVKKTADITVGIAKHKRCYGDAVSQPDLWMVPN